MVIIRYFLLFFMVLVLPLSVSAVDLSSERSEKILQEIFAGKDFHNEKKITSVRLREETDPAKNEEEMPEWIITFIEWLENREWDDDASDSITLVNLLEALLWIVAVVAIFWLLYRYRALLGTWLPHRRAEKQSPAPVTEVLFGLDLTEQSLPDDVPDQVLKLWFNKQPREAIGLLYRASLSRLIHQYDFEFFDGHTERECAALVAARTDTDESQLSVYVEGLTAIWTRLAYAHRLPTDQQVQQLCQFWPQIFNQTDANNSSEGRR